VRRRALEYFLIALTSVLYLVAAVSRSRRPFWYDELFTLYVSQLDGMSTVWAALKDGADLNPPLFYITTRFFTSLAGANELSLRLPAILGYLVLCLSLRTFTARKLGFAWGLAAMWIPMICGSMFYATEARAYGQVLGFTGLAAVAWQGLQASSRRTQNLLCLAACLAGALLTHCYAVLILAPFGLAEAARSWQHRRIDWPAAAAVCLPGLVALSYLPLMGAISPVAVDNEVFRPTWMSIPMFFTFMLWPVILPILAASMAVPIHGLSRPSRPAKGNGFALSESILALGFLLVPLLAMLLAALVTRIYMPRYGLAAILGLTIFLCSLLWRMGERRTAAGYTAAAVFAISFLLIPGRWPHNQTREQDLFAQAMKLETTQPELPIVVSSGLLFLEIDHYAPPPLASRLHFIGDAALARKWTGTDMFDKSFPGLRRWFPLRASLEAPDSFLPSHTRFLVYGMVGHPMDWLVDELRVRRWNLKTLDQNADRILYLAEPPGALAEKP